MTRWEAEQCFNNLLAHFPMSAKTAERGRGAYLDKLERLDWRAACAACEEITVRSRRFPTIAELFELTRAKERLQTPAPFPAALTGDWEAPHPDGPIVPKAEAARRMREIIAKLKTSGVGRNPFLTPAEVWEIHHRWTPEFRAIRVRQGMVCDCCVADPTMMTRGERATSDERDPGVEG